MDITSILENPRTYSRVYCASTLVGICTYVALIIISTPKSGAASLLRYSSPAIVLGVGQHLFQELHGISGSLSHRIIKRFDAEDLVEEKIIRRSDSLVIKVYRVVCLILNVRGVGTPWQAKHLSEFPKFYTARDGSRKPTRAWYIIRQLAIVAWQYLLLDFIYASSMETLPEDTQKVFGHGVEYTYLDATGEQWMGRFIVGVVAWAIPGRVTIDFTYRILSIVAVLSGFSSPEQWPPLFGSIWDAYTIRGFWSTFWHSYCRWTLTTISNFICRDLLRLPRPSLVERYMNVAGVFLTSAVIHMAIDAHCWGPPSKFPALAFFGSCVIGIIIEDTVQALWRRITVSQKSGGVPTWHKLVGYLWVSFWFVMTAPWYLYHNTRLPPDDTWVVPVSVIDRIGSDGVKMVLLIGGVVLRFTSGIEV
ncbi:acetyltransferase [Fusarium flagelliforme]|uniref:acetyltransferase n=1 Tax=Fusarium flagelliforme TaxID=2675880 RepID=UPI001E8D76FF|nr:acetyltransferase [Fusarium flagelliforme]KAH7174891.1 acetyltransferase [Fusarium flagelliforme]